MLFCFVLFFMPLLCYFILGAKSFPKTLERFWYNDINNLVLFAEIQRKYNAVFVSSI